MKAEPSWSDLNLRQFGGLRAGERFDECYGKANLEPVTEADDDSTLLAVVVRTRRPWLHPERRPDATFAVANLSMSRCHGIPSVEKRRHLHDGVYQEPKRFGMSETLARA